MSYRANNANAAWQRAKESQSAAPKVRVYLVQDASVTRQRNELITGRLSLLRQYFDIRILPGHLNEGDAIKQQSREPADVILLPWEKYLSWKKFDGHLGPSRLGNPTTIGYYSGPDNHFPSEPTSNFSRVLLFDLFHMSKGEVFTLLHAAAVNSRRNGIRSLLENHASVYRENWYPNTQPGNRADAAIQVQEIQTRDWVNRANEIRLSVLALWSLVFEECFPPGSLANISHSEKDPIAHFQLGADNQSVVLRLCLSTPKWNPRDLIRRFWKPSPVRTADSAELLMSYADFVRIQFIHETPALEFVVGFLGSAPSLKSNLRSLWIETISKDWVRENPVNQLSDGVEHQPLPDPTIPVSQSLSQLQSKLKIKERAIIDTHKQIRELKNELQEKDRLLKELKSGGIGVQKEAGPPETGTLIESLGARFSEIEHSMKKFEQNLKKVRKYSAANPEYFKMRKDYYSLIRKADLWAVQVREIIGKFEDFKRKKAA